jgi:hypothetical protein
LRNLPRLEEFVVSWEFPLMRLAPELNPEALRRPQSKNKVCTDREFVDRFIGTAPIARRDILAKAEGISARTVDRYLQRLTEAGVICCGSGLYWRKET